MKKFLVITLVIVVVCAIGLALFIFISGPNLKQFEHLKEPQISTLPNQKMIEVQLQGNPNDTAGNAIGQLFSTFYQLKNNQIKQTIPRARRPVSLETSKKNWIGIYGMPVPDNITELPPQKGEVKVKLTTWEYGAVAEILHVGPYSAEPPTIDKLKDFIQTNGYIIIGDHEEEYLKGPGLWPTNPKDYYTIIRYRVQQK